MLVFPSLFPRDWLLALCTTFTTYTTIEFSEPSTFLCDLAEQEKAENIAMMIRNIWGDLPFPSSSSLLISNALNAFIWNVNLLFNKGNFD